MSTGAAGGIEKDNCLQIAKDITVAAIQKDFLRNDAEEISKFFSTVYARVFSVGMKSLIDLEKTF